MRRSLTLAFVIAAFAVPVTASAEVVELGGGVETARAVCPDNDCAAPGKLTGYQGRSGKVANPFLIKRSGTIVAFTVSVARPESNQIDFFERTYGTDPPQVRLAILRRGKRKGAKRNFRLMQQSKSYRVDKYYGSSPTFALDKPMRVDRGRIIGITIPTWAPIFGRPTVGKNWWRASRAKGRCKDVQADVQHNKLGDVKTYGCDYFNVRFMYTVTYIPDPKPTEKPKPTRKPKPDTGQ